MPIHLTRARRREIEEHGVDAYPHECCGALLGQVEGEARVVIHNLRIDNAREEGVQHNRFLITDQDYLRVEREAADAGLTLLGFYHSHPDHPARPSQYDLDHAFPWFSYVIVAVANAAPGDLTSWILHEDRSRFQPEEVVAESEFDGPKPSQGA